MGKELDGFSSEFIDIIGELSRKFAISRIGGQIYGLLFISPEPLSLDHITEKLKISKGSVSMNIRELENRGAVRKVWVKGSRKDFYQANLDTLNVVLNRLKIGLQIRLEEFIGRINNVEVNINKKKEEDPKNKRELQIYRDRISKIKNMHEKLKDFLSFLDNNADRI